MPAARQRSRSPFIAWAVMAMSGMCPPVALLAGADRGGRLEAVHLGHLHVHQHQVERLPARARRAPRGRCAATVDRVARLLEQAHARASG